MILGYSNVNVNFCNFFQTLSLIVADSHFQMHKPIIENASRSVGEAEFFNGIPRAEVDLNELAYFCHL